MRTRLVSALLPALLAGASALAAAPGGVSVTLQQPDQFTDLHPPHLADDLAALIEQGASRHVGEEQRLDIVVTDVDMAGGFEPRSGAHERIRIMAPTFPPRIDLRFTLTDADDNVLAEGERTLRDLSYLMRPRLEADPDPLVYERQIINEWLIQEFGG